LLSFRVLFARIPSKHPINYLSKSWIHPELHKVSVAFVVILPPIKSVLKMMATTIVETAKQNKQVKIPEIP